MTKFSNLVVNKVAHKTEHASVISYCFIILLSH